MTTNQDGPSADDFAMKVWREAMAAPEPLGTLSLGRKRDEWAARVLSEAFEKVRAEERAGGWMPIETAPYDQRVEVRVGHMTLIAKLYACVSIDEDGNDCDQWSAVFEGEHPPCWSEGACWSSNEDEMMSIQPTAWRPLEQGAHDNG